MNAYLRKSASIRGKKLTPEVGLDGICCVNQRLTFCLSECPAVDKCLHLTNEGAELVAGCARLTGIELGRNLVEFVDQATALILRERAIRD
jgi:hypothetical protein